MSTSPDKWQQTKKCFGKSITKNGNQHLTGCGKEFTITFFDLYRTTHWSGALFSFGDYTLYANCKNCGVPNYIPYTKPTRHNEYFSPDDISSVDKRFIDKLPFKFTDFFSNH